MREELVLAVHPKTGNPWWGTKQIIDVTEYELVETLEIVKDEDGNEQKIVSEDTVEVKREVVVSEQLAPEGYKPVAYDQWVAAWKKATEGAFVPHPDLNAAGNKNLKALLALDAWRLPEKVVELGGVKK